MPRSDEELLGALSGMFDAIDPPPVLPVSGCARDALNHTLAAAVPREYSFTVHGTPAGQGQITFLGPGRGAKHTNEKTLKPWRQSIITAAKRATGCHEYVEWGALKFCAVCRVPSKDHGLLAGVPVGVDLTVTVEKPKTAPKRVRSYPITRYSTDTDHHARACLDALSASGLLHDDAQVVELTARKVYPGEHELALDRPGARIRVWELGALERAA